jgi:hypothetical protein
MSAVLWAPRTSCEAQTTPRMLGSGIVEILLGLEARNHNLDIAVCITDSCPVGCNQLSSKGRRGLALRPQQNWILETGEENESILKNRKARYNSSKSMKSSRTPSLKFSLKRMSVLAFVDIAADLFHIHYFLRLPKRRGGAQ